MLSPVFKSKLILDWRGDSLLDKSGTQTVKFSNNGSTKLGINNGSGKGCGRFVSAVSNRLTIISGNVVGLDMDTNDFAIEMICKLNAIPNSTRYLISKGGVTTSAAYYLYFSGASATLIAQCRSNSAPCVSGATTSLADLKMHHILVIAARSGSLYVYKDGLLVDSKAFTNQLTLAGGGGGFYIAGSATSSTDCDVNLVRIYRFGVNELTTSSRSALLNETYAEYLVNKQKQISAPIQRLVYPKPLKNNSSGIISAYSFAPEVPLSTVTDITGNAFTGTATGTFFTKEGRNFCGVLCKVAFGNVSPSVRSVAFRIKLSTTTQKIMEGTAGGNSIYANAGTLTAPFSKIYVNGVESSTIVAGYWQSVYMTNTTDVAFTAFTLGLNGTTYGSFEIADLQLFSTTKTLQDAKTYYNDYANQLYLHEDFEVNGAGGLVKIPIGWRNGTNTCNISSLLNGVSATLPRGKKFLQFSASAKTMILPIDLSKLLNNGYISYDYYTSSTTSWSNRSGWVNAPVTGVSYSNGLLTFTNGVASDGITNIIIRNGQSV